jgi:hypothetical protein
LANGVDADGLGATVRTLAVNLPPANLGRLNVARIGRFLALLPDRNPSALAAFVVKGLDRIRAPPGEAELGRRRENGPSAAQAALLDRWGYP